MNMQSLLDFEIVELSVDIKKKFLKYFRMC